MMSLTNSESDLMVQQDGSRGDIIFYSSPEGGIELDVRLQQELLSTVLRVHRIIEF